MTAPRPFLDRFPKLEWFNPGKRPASLLCAALVLSALGPGCQSASDGHEGRESVRAAIQAENYQEAVTLAAKVRGATPDDPALVELHRSATIAFYLDRARRATLAGEDDEALAHIASAREAAPESDLVYVWEVKTKYKLADKWLAIGNEAFAVQNLDGASEAYIKVLNYVPRHPSALSGLGQVTILLNYRNGLGEGYYKEGIRALADYRLRSARRGFSATTKYLPELGRAKRRATEVDQLLAGQRVEVALGFEAEGLYAGALNEFRFASLLDGENQEAVEGIARLEREAEAAELLRDAQMLIYRRRFEEALVLLDEGEGLTEAQTEAFQDARESITGQRLEVLYQDARVLEQDGDYAAAIDAYKALLATADYYKDARARQSTLEGYTEMAAGYYEEAVAAEDDEVRLQHLRSIEGFWPDYKTPEGTPVGVLIDELEGQP
jgi:tetratricopeptide (TPR) repeat protein